MCGFGLRLGFLRKSLLLRSLARFFDGLRTFLSLNISWDFVFPGLEFGPEF